MSFNDDMSDVDNYIPNDEQDMLNQTNNVESDDNENQLPSNFDTNFDAGVEADEETDPKKYIQQLTGKLSQSLNSYNNENGEPDVELGKYVLGMIIKQGTKGMDEKDRKDIIKKLNTSNSESEELENDTPEESNVDDESLDLTQNESKKIKLTKKQIFENFGVNMDDNIEKKDKTPDTKIKSDTIKNNRTKPFQAPNKFK